MKKLLLKITVFLAVASQAGMTYAQITPKQAATHLQKGINLGNSLDAPKGETSWGNPPGYL